jgi:S-adenosylmethionine-diacylglycerol 3-amino-3-carboxypropyl transferase
MSKKYFTGLNYTLGNEDTSVEIGIVNLVKPKKVFSICGSGGRCLPLVSSETEQLVLSDLSKEQLQLADLRHSTYKELEHDDFLKFWGYFPYRDDDNCDFRKKIFYSLDLDPETKSFFEKVFLELNFQSVLYLGKWERTFQILSNINKMLLGSDFDKMMRFDNLHDQISYYQSQFPLLKWKTVIFMLGNKSLFNALLYKGDFIEKNSKLTHFEYYFNAFHRLFTNDLAKNSFFLQLCFYGKIKSFEGVPVEASLDTFVNVKKSIAAIDYINQDFVSYLAQGKNKFDFLSLSDVPSYFKGDLERDYLQKIKPALNNNAIVVVRYYLRVSHADLTDYVDVSNDYRSLIDSERVQMYDIRVYKYTSK